MITGPHSAALPPAERLVNLTPHEIVLDAAELPGDASEPDTVVNATVHLMPEGQFARVDDDASRLSDGWLNAGTGLVAFTRLRRSGRLISLPAPVDGTRLVVSRVTAVAARHRADLVFPLGELRDQAGRVSGAQGLAAFQPSWAPVQRYRDWHAAAAGRRAGKALGREWLTGVPAPTSSCGPARAL